MGIGGLVVSPFLRKQLLCIGLASTALSGCGGGGGSAPPGQVVEPYLSMAGSAYQCGAVTLSQGGGQMSSTRYSCTGTLNAPAGAATSITNTCQAGFQEALNASCAQ